MKTGFLILHYNATEITKKCVTSIQNLDGGKDTIIIIVDNASSNGSGQELLEEYQKTEQVQAHLLVLLFGGSLFSAALHDRG